jgi:hypothetical protein
VLIVAITRWARSIDEEVPVLAPLLGLVAFDLRLRLAGPIPVLLARADKDRADELVGLLRERGHGAIACDLDDITDSAEMVSPRTYQFGGDDFIASHPSFGSQAVPWADFVALIRASTVVEETSQVSKQKKFSMTRAVLTGGMVMRRTKTTLKQSRSQEREQVLYIFCRTGPAPILLRQTRLHHQGLGDQVAHSSLDNFSALIEQLRRHASHAMYDEGLLTSRRQSSLASIGRTSSDSTNRSSNVSETDLAAHLLAVAHLNGQL